MQEQRSIYGERQMKKDKEFIGLELSKELKEKLDKECSEKEMSLSCLVRLILKEHYSKE